MQGQYQSYFWISYKCSKFECQSTRLLGTKIVDEFVDVDGMVHGAMTSGSMKIFCEISIKKTRETVLTWLIGRYAPEVS